MIFVLRFVFLFHSIYFTERAISLEEKNLKTMSFLWTSSVDDVSDRFIAFVREENHSGEDLLEMVPRVGVRIGELKEPYFSQLRQEADELFIYSGTDCDTDWLRARLRVELGMPSNVVNFSMAAFPSRLQGYYTLMKSKLDRVLARPRFVSSWNLCYDPNF